MKNLRLNIPVILFLVSILFGCTQHDRDADAEADIAAVREVLDRYVHAASTDDLDLFMTCWADDAKRMEPNFDVIVGKEKIRAHFKIIFDQFNNIPEFYGEIDIEVDNNLAFTQANGIISLTPKEGGPTTLLDLKVVDIYKRQADGSWKIYIDCINPNPEWSDDSISPELLDKQDQSDPLL